MLRDLPLEQPHCVIFQACCTAVDTVMWWCSLSSAACCLIICQHTQGSRMSCHGAILCFSFYKEVHILFQVSTHKKPDLWFNQSPSPHLGLRPQKEIPAFTVQGLIGWRLHVPVLVVSAGARAGTAVKQELHVTFMNTGREGRGGKGTRCCNLSPTSPTRSANCGNPGKPGNFSETCGRGRRQWKTIASSLSVSLSGVFKHQLFVRDVVVIKSTKG